MNRFIRLPQIGLAGAAYLTVMAGLASANTLSPAPLPEAAESAIGYETVAAALTGLRSQPGVVFSTENGWLIATDEAAYTIWSFAPQGYPAYPAVVMRKVVAQGAGSVIHMNVLCEASKEDCDDLVRTFADLNGLPVGQ
jgi:hypothetical protein